jgi:hypothetical protein
MPTAISWRLPVISPGDTLVNPVSGETLTFVETAAQTGGDYTVVECRVQPGRRRADGARPPAPAETFEVLEGELTLRAGRDKLVRAAR